MIKVRNNAKTLLKKGIAVAVIVLFIGMSITSAGNIIEQSSRALLYNGKTLYVGGDGPGNYSRIQDAIDNGSDGDTVFVYNDSSPYYENIVINKSIKLLGKIEIQRLLMVIGMRYIF